METTLEFFVKVLPPVIKTASNACLSVMIVCLLLQGLFLFARDAVTRNLPSSFLYSDYAWTMALMSLVFIRRIPAVTFFSAVIAAIVFGVALQSNALHQTFLWFLLSNGLVIINSGVAAINWWVIHRGTEADHA